MDQVPTVRKGQIAFQALLLVGSLVLFWEAYKIEGISSISGSGIFPMLAALALVLSLVVRIVADYRLLKQQDGAVTGVKPGFRTDILPTLILLFMLVCVAYAVAMNYLGFWIPTAAFLVIAFAWLYSRNPIKVALIAGGSLAFIYVIFAFVFKVYLP